MDNTNLLETESKEGPSIKKEEQKQSTAKNVAKSSDNSKISIQENENRMAQMLEKSGLTPSEDDIVEGPVIATDKSAVFIDLSPYGTGIIFGREFRNARDVIRKINQGDTVAAKVVMPENEQGYVELSLKEARQALIWGEAENVMREKRVLQITPKEANKGGLILEWQGLSGFLPASQLSSDHYPKVEGGDKEKILDELRALTDKQLSVTIISTQPKEGKLIFSEKSSEFKEKEGLVSKYAVGDVLDGEVTGIVDFGVFIKIEENLEGLVHLSEIDWGLVEDPHAFVTSGQKVKVQVIDVKDGKVSLSIKALKPNQWLDAGKKYKKGAQVDGVIIKYNKHGALASIEEGIAGLVHISEFYNSLDDLKHSLELGKSYPFIITLFDAEHQRMALSHRNLEEETKSD